MFSREEIHQLREVVRALFREELAEPIKCLTEKVQKMSEVATQLTTAVEALESEDSALAQAIAAIAPEFTALDEEVEALNKKLAEAESGEVTITKAEGDALTERVNAVGTQLQSAAQTVTQAVEAAKPAPAS